MDCAACHTPLPDSARYCLSCGSPVRPPADGPSDPLREALEAAIGFQYRVERRLGRGGMGAVYLAHEQPGWWGTWYPRALRRPGDVWHRLPRRIRRFNIAVGLTAAVFLLVSMPLPVLVVAEQGYAARTGRPSALGAVVEQAIALKATQILLGIVFFLPFAALVALTAEAVVHGRRLVKTLGPSLPDPELAARALYTPSWRHSFWERPPFDSLLLPEPRPPSREVPVPPPPPAPGTESPTVTRPGDVPPREG